MKLDRPKQPPWPSRLLYPGYHLAQVESTMKLKLKGNMRIIRNASLPENKVEVRFEISET